MATITVKLHAHVNECVMQNLLTDIYCLSLWGGKDRQNINIFLRLQNKTPAMKNLVILLE